MSLVFETRLPSSWLLFTQHLESLLLLNSSGETRRICFPSLSKIDLIGVVKSKIIFFTARRHASVSIAYIVFLSVSLSLSLVLFAQTRLGLLLCSADIMSMGILKILMHKWSMLHCTRLWHAACFSLAAEAAVVFWSKKGGNLLLLVKSEIRFLLSKRFIWITHTFIIHLKSCSYHLHYLLVVAVWHLVILCSRISFTSYRVQRLVC